MNGLDDFHDQCSLDNDDYAHCENCLSDFHTDTGIRAKNGDLLCSTECAAEIDFDTQREI